MGTHPWLDQRLVNSKLLALTVLTKMTKPAYHVKMEGGVLRIRGTFVRQELTLKLSVLPQKIRAFLALLELSMLLVTLKKKGTDNVERASKVLSLKIKQFLWLEHTIQLLSVAFPLNTALKDIITPTLGESTGLV